MGYRVHRENDMFKVVEVVEGEVRDIVTNVIESKAKQMSRDFNLGYAFDGWTPNFFLNKLSQSV